MKRLVLEHLNLHQSRLTAAQGKCGMPDAHSQRIMPGIAMGNDMHPLSRQKSNFKQTQRYAAILFVGHMFNADDLSKGMTSQLMQPDGGTLSGH
ncbi:hypothetical protein GALL_472460 [mine drainage metagenome]|uniref:Uncharacterized protein n=1 Tax=mine drainage metagenome TaxID=410659 RepID=A0A1J5Q0W4_9ZZZZ